ncbi:MAG: SagB/ThcOx family dehydrogenase [Endomicrobia bacterium]|nr:SagB/ThcOx family dehydrogenase [Endomicrobiia bacterium]
MQYLPGKICFMFFGLVIFMVIALSGCRSETHANQKSGIAAAKIENSQLTYTLPSPKTKGNVSVEDALANRRSRREFQNRELSAEQLSQILWAAYGITLPINNPLLRGGLRTAPSAGALYPLEIYAVVGNVEGIEAGVYKYISQEHKIIRTIDRDVREELSAAALNQVMIRDASVTVVYAAVFSRVVERYGQRGVERYVFMEIGHSAQNIYLQAEALGLSTCAIAAFTDGRVSELLRLPEEESPLYLMPTGYFN